MVGGFLFVCIFPLDTFVEENSLSVCVGFYLFFLKDFV